MATRFHITLPEPARARGNDPVFSFTAQGAEEFAAQLQDALRTNALFERWRTAQDDPEEVDPALGMIDPATTVEGHPDDLHVDLIVVTTIPGDILRHRLRLLAGNAWELRDVSKA